MLTRLLPGTRYLIVLPAVLARHPSGWFYFVAWTPYILAYQLCNRFPLRTPMELDMGALDRGLPFIPELLPIYVAYIPFFFWTVYRSRTEAEVNRLFYGTHLQLLLSLPCFLLLPIAMPRRLFYPPSTFGWADAFWRWFDEPNNCFPSLHVSNCLLFLQFNWKRPARLPHTALGIAIIASTVLVKQHYAIDVIGGVVVYLATRRVLGLVRIAGVE